MKPMRHILASDHGCKPVRLPWVLIQPMSAVGLSVKARAPRERVVVLDGRIRYTEGEVARSRLSTQARLPIDGALNFSP